VELGAADSTDSDDALPGRGLECRQRRQHEWHQPPSRKHPFGTDLEGKDLLSRTVYGAKIALTVGLLVGATAALIGLVLGAIAGYKPGILDEIIVWLYTTVDAIPYILLLVALSFVMRQWDIDPLMRVWLAMTATFWTGTARVIRGEVIKQRNRDYVAAAKALGASETRILFAHIVPNVLHLAVINFSLLFVGAIKNEVILSVSGSGRRRSAELGHPSGQREDGARRRLLVAAHGGDGGDVFPGVGVQCVLRCAPRCAGPEAASVSGKWSVVSGQWSVASRRRRQR
jgi:ABC-type dipeptide/oligopeptide/nickel transport system permease subunit